MYFSDVSDGTVTDELFVLLELVRWLVFLFLKIPGHRTMYWKPLRAALWHLGLRDCFWIYLPWDFAFKVDYTDPRDKGRGTPYER